MEPYTITYSFGQPLHETPKVEVIEGDGPLKDAFEASTAGVVMKVITTYRYHNGVLQKEEVTRKYQNNGDYHDSSVVTPLATASSV